MIVGRGRPSPEFGETELLGWMVMVWASVEVGAPIPLLLPALGAGLALVARRPWLLGVAVVALAAGLSHRAEQAYQLAERQNLDHVAATIVLDAEPSRFGWRAEAELDDSGQRVQLVGSGFGTPDLVAGEHVEVSGRLAPIEPSPWLKSRHVVGAVTVSGVDSIEPPAWYLRPGEWLRGAVLGSTGTFSPGSEALYHGLVIGDDRFQSEGQRAQFRAAGLSHLLAVSGQNVAFLLAVASPILRRIRPSYGFVLTAVLLATFAVATRLEPSVLRATATAAVSVAAVARSSRASGVRALSVAVIGLLLVDPFLSGSVGFRLSVAASMGILLLAPTLSDRLPGPDFLAVPLSITVAAQLGVGPLLMLEFGPVSIVTIPANVLAGWAAGAVMTLGLSVGIVASILPEPVAGLVQLPSRGLVWWIASVAGIASRAPVPSVGLATIPALALSSAAVLTWRPSGTIRRAAAGSALALVVFLTSPRPPELPGWFPATDSTPSILVLEGSGPSAESLLAARIRKIDIVVVERGGWSDAQAVGRVRDVAVVGVVLAPGDHRIVGARRVLENLLLPIDGGALVIDVAPDGLSVEVQIDGVPQRADGRGRG